MAEITRAATAAALSLALVLPFAGVATAATARPAATAQPTAATAVPADALQLTRPTGPYAVGRTTTHLTDRSRTDPWVPTADGRELMMTLHYPAARAGDGRTARYSTVEEARLLAEGQDIDALVPAEVLSATGTHGRVGARPAKGKYPLVILSPGFSVSRFTLTSLAEDLASRGYVVASLDHAYESFGISVPGGRTLTCVACPIVSEDLTQAAVVTATRADDVSYVLDRLIGDDPVWRYAGIIDKRHVGMAGHSIGGASAATAMAGDRRVDAGINMDGAFWEDLPAEGLGGRPFMMLGADDVHQPGGPDATWDRTWPALDGWKRWVTFAGSEHFTFTDGPLISRHFGLPQPPLPADRAVTLTRTYVAAFFDQHLRGRPQPVLAGPTAANPEVKFHNP
ncbi:alpha/beta hydrolase family protein [Streptomyces sp. NPDC091292]|uniref:alpha/beta hydrolase family protein n=1 Tax=Streptomyces sp. NPDC091292 TaxID=3365991 RepID=UPI0037FB0A6D